MATNTAPLLSFTASGQIGKTQVYSKWKGRPYVRRYVVPSNPKSTDQMKTRNVFGFLNGVWRVAPADFQTPWTAYAKGKVLTDRNAFLGKNIALLRAGSDLTGLIMSPGANGGTVATVTPTGGAGQVTINLADPDVLPAGWSVVKAVAAVLKQQDPHSGTAYDVKTGTDLTSPYSIVITGLTAGTYMVAGWFVFQRSALATDLAYSPATATTVVVT